MMMKNLIKTLWFILAVVWPSAVMAAPLTDSPQITTTTDPNKIINNVCIMSDRTETKCDDVENTIIDDWYKCFSISSTWSVVEVDSDNEWNMKFRCDASSAGQHTFHFDCGNWVTYDKTGNNWYAEYTCNYTWASVWDILNVSCRVDDEELLNPSCKKRISIGIPPLSDCWDGVIELNEDCDFQWMQYHPLRLYEINTYLNSVAPYVDAWIYTTDNGYYCRNCSLVYSGSTGTNFVYEPIECHSVDKPISVMNNEIIPFWWRLNMHNDTMTVTNDSGACDDRTDDQGTLIRPRNCYFAIYNWSHKQGEEDVQHFTIPCYNSYFTGYKIYKYFSWTHQTKADGASVHTVQAYTDSLTSDKCDDWDQECEFGEYKLVLEQVYYDVCDPDEWRTWWKRSGPVCEVNAAITRPYAMQISTFGANPIGATEKDFLYDYYDMYWNSILDSTNLRWTMNISSGTYASEWNLDEEIQKFRDKYEKLAVTVNNSFRVNGTSIASIFEGATTIKKVPNKHIYFVEWNGGKLQLKQDVIGGATSAYTIFVDWMDVEIKWNVLQYAMIITTEKIIFKDKWQEGYSACASWWQVVQWLFVAQDWFKSGDPTWNRDYEHDFWCPWWWLHVKWALMWPWITNLMNWKRSQLNSWFNTSSHSQKGILNERKQKIIGWAAVLIEYSPSLWKILPPGAEIFTESLEVYRR